MKKALITGITGQDGSYLAEFLLNKNYEVHGLRRRSSSFNTERIDHIYKDPIQKSTNLYLHYGDMTDTSSINQLVKSIEPDEIYNFAAQSHVAVSFENPEYTANSDALGALRILESIRLNKFQNKTKFYQASTSELYGKITESPQNEKTAFYPRSPYAVAKLYAYWITVNYREAYKIFACNGILFNHESKRRGETFVTRKITRGLARISCGTQKCIHLGNLSAKRDWGHAKDYVKATWMILQKDNPSDYVISSQKQYSVKEFIEKAAQHINIKITWSGKGVNEKGIDQNGKIIIKVDPGYFRPAEVDTLLGDSTKAKKDLGWSNEISFDDLVKEMMINDLELAKKEKIMSKL